MSRHLQAETATPTKTPARIAFLDVLRGFALCGIIFVNIAPLLNLSTTSTPSIDTPHILDLLVQQRFFPIFSFLFGIGFALTLESAARRHARPRTVLARRLGALLILGLAHQMLQPGEALLPYAICGLLVLLPMSWAPAWAVLTLGTVLTTAAITVGGGVMLIPGMVLLGMATVRYGVHRTLPSLRVNTGVLIAALAVALPALVLQENQRLEPGGASDMWSALAGLSMATVYCSIVLLLLRTKLNLLFVAVFAPLGRLALTNYICATILILVLGHSFGLYESSKWSAAMILCFAILFVQWIFSTTWMRTFDQGPLEWVWRSITWWTIRSPRKTYT